MNKPEFRFYPIFDPYRNGRPMGWGEKVVLSLGLGVIYAVLQYVNLDDKAVYFQQYCWILSIIISASMLALYVATAIFRDSLEVLGQTAEGSRTIQSVLRHLTTNRAYLASGLVFAGLTTVVSSILGIPEDFASAAVPLFAIYLGCFMTGFTSGMGLWGIYSVIALYLRFAPNLQHTLNPDNPDGNGGIKRLGDSLWYFATLLAAVGVLVACYMFSAEWTNLESQFARSLFLTWLAMPFVLAVSVVLIPGLAVRRQVDRFKEYRREQLKRERASVYSSYKEFAAGDDDEIIAKKKQLEEKLEEIQGQMERLQRMRTSPIDSRQKN